MLTADAAPLLPTGLTLGEGPRWFADALWLVDIIAGKVIRSRPSAGQWAAPQIWDLKEQVGMIGALAPAATGRVVLASEAGWQLFNPQTAECSLIANPIPESGLRFNDGAVDPAGRFVTGSMPLDMPAEAGVLWSLETDGRYQKRLDGLTCPNGIAWTADGGTMAFIDSPLRAVQLFAYDPASGSIGPELRRIDLSDVPGVPDGCCLDSQGLLWIGFWGGACVRAYDLASGELCQHISCPTNHITACALCGPEMNELVITSSTIDCDQAQAGDCFRITVPSSGLPASAWGGETA